jgi:hypothetical protein
MVDSNKIVYREKNLRGAIANSQAIKVPNGSSITEVDFGFNYLE